MVAKKTEVVPRVMGITRAQAEVVGRLIASVDLMDLANFSETDRTTIDELYSEVKVILGASVTWSEPRTLPECNGHSAEADDPLGETVYCDGTCRSHELDGKRDEFKIRLDFAFEVDVESDAAGVCDRWGIDKYSVVQLIGPAGGCPVVEFRGTHESLTRLCEARGGDERELIEQVEEGDELQMVRRRPWNTEPTKMSHDDGGAVMAIVEDDDGDTSAHPEEHSCHALPYCDCEIRHDDVVKKLSRGEETGGGDLSGIEIAEALS